MATSKEKLERLKRVREKMLSKKGGFRRDPDEWKPPQVAAGVQWKAKGYILPPLNKGEKGAAGVAVKGMDDLFFLQVGDHWVNRKRYPCPRIYDGDSCVYCQLGFNLLGETDEKKARREISSQYLPRTQYVVNLYFPNISTNPEELRGRVVFYAMPKTIFDKLDQCLALDDGGDDPDNPRAWGLFYDESEAYPLIFDITKKGDYNTYDECKLSFRSGPIAPSDDEIEAILVKRHDLPTKYPDRTPENLKTLQGFVNTLLDGVSDDGDGFDADESTPEPTPEPTPAKKPAAKKKAPAKKKAAEPAVEESASTVEVDDPELAALLEDIKND